MTRSHTLSHAARPLGKSVVCGRKAVAVKVSALFEQVSADSRPTALNGAFQSHCHFPEIGCVPKDVHVNGNA